MAVRVFDPRRATARLAAVIVLLLFTGQGLAQQNGAKAERNLRFVRQIISQLAVMEGLRATAEKDVAESRAAGMPPWNDCIRDDTRMKLEINSQIVQLGSLPHVLVETADRKVDLLPIYAELYVTKLRIIAEFMEACIVFAEGPKPDIDYGKLSSHAPQLTAQLYEVDHTLFQTTPLLFSTLIDLERDGHLIITTKQRDALIKELTLLFGDNKLSQKGDQPYLLASGAVLRNLLSNWPGSDAD